MQDATFFRLFFWSADSRTLKMAARENYLPAYEGGNNSILRFDISLFLLTFNRNLPFGLYSLSLGTIC